MVTRERLAELSRYVLASALSACVTLGLPVVLHEGFAVHEPTAVGIALVCTFFLNFVTTRRFVFRSAGKAQGELWRFAATSIGFRIAEYVAFLLLFSAGFVYYYAQIIVVLVSFVVKFLTIKYFVFGKRAAPDAVL